MPPGAAAGTMPPLGRILVFPLATLAAGTVSNVPLAERAGKAGDALGAGLGFVTTKAGGVLVAVNSRANTMLGKFTGRVDFLTAKKAALGDWAAASAELPARAALTNFGVSVAVTVLAGKTVAAVGAPGAAGVRAAMDGTDPGLGQTLVFDGANAAVPLLAMDGATSPLMRGGRALGTDVTFTDFNGDGRPDLVVGAPNLQVPAASARATEVAPFYAQESPGCIATAAQSTGGVLISLGMADGTFQPAYRLWAPADIPGCMPANAMDTKCRRSSIGRGVIGGFDFDGDGKQDVGTLRSQGFEVFLGRAPADASLAKLTMVCDPVLSVPSVGQTTSAPAMVGDLDGDKCADVGFRYSADGTRGGFYVAFGFDAGGRCGATHVVPAGLRLSGDADAGLAPMGLGLAAVRAGRFLDDGKDHVAISATRFLHQGIAQPAILFFDAAALAKRRPPMGEVVVGAIEDGLEPVVLAPRERGTGFGQVLAGSFDLNGDGKPDLVVSAPGASFGSEGGGAVFIYAGGRPAAAPEILLTLAGDVRERSNFGQSVALFPGAGAAVPTLVVGAPASYRTGTQNGTAFLLPLRY
jgi:hypothetical protein